MMLASSAFGDFLMNITVNNFRASFSAYVENFKYFCWKAACRACLAGEMAESPAAVPPSACSGQDALAQTGSEVESSWQLHLPACSCWHSQLSLDLKLPKQDVIEANSFAGHLPPLGLLPSFRHCFLKRENSNSLGLQMLNALGAVRKCAFFHQLQLIKLAIIQNVVNNDQSGKFFSVYRNLL